MDMVYDNWTIFGVPSQIPGVELCFRDLLYLSNLASGASFIDTQMHMKAADKQRNSHILVIRIKTMELLQLFIEQNLSSGQNGET